MRNNTLIRWALVAGLAAALPAYAVSNPVEVGAQSGAMQYCSGKAKSDEERVRYNVLMTTYMKDMDRLSAADKNMAFVIQAQTNNSGAYHGRKLDRGNCGKLLEQFTRSQIYSQNRQK
jgi:hypothetical protein